MIIKVEYNNLYTHFVFSTLHRLPLITENNRERIEKYITGIVNNNQCQLYAIYANPEHLHLLISRNHSIDEEPFQALSKKVSINSSTKINYVLGIFNGSQLVLHFQYQNQM